MSSIQRFIVLLYIKIQFGGFGGFFYTNNIGMGRKTSKHTCFSQGLKNTDDSTETEVTACKTKCCKITELLLCKLEWGPGTVQLQ